MSTTGAGPNLFAQLTAVLTDAAHRTLADQVGTDFADLLTQALVATAANVGGSGVLLSGRAGSRESHRIAELLHGAMDEALEGRRFRTEPLSIPLNVAELIESGDRHPGLLGLKDCINQIEGASAERPAGDPLAVTPDDPGSDKVNRYTASYAEYDRRLEKAMHAVGVELALSFSIKMLLDVDPGSSWWDSASIVNPTPWSDPLVEEVWARAHAIVPLPNVDIESTVRMPEMSTPDPCASRTEE